MRWRTVAPSIMTLVGLFLAFLSLSLTSKGRFEPAAWAIFAAAFADLFDGAMARVLGRTSPLGKQLDSLVDLVSAGVAPAFLVYRACFEGWGLWGVAMGYAWVVAVALRLARFNADQAPDPLFFVGVPCPIAASVLTQYLVFSRATWGHDGNPRVAALLVLVIGALMLSTVPYWKSTTLMPQQFFRHPYGPCTAVVLLLVIPFPKHSLFVGTSVSLVGAVWIQLHRVLLRSERNVRKPLPPLEDEPTPAI